MLAMTTRLNLMDRRWDELRQEEAEVCRVGQAVSGAQSRNYGACSLRAADRRAFARLEAFRLWTQSSRASCPGRESAAVCYEIE